MKNALKILKTCLSLFLVSCQSVDLPDPIVVTQCNVVFTYSEDGSILEKDSACLCRDYKYSTDYVGPYNNGNAKIFPLNACDNITGHPPEDQGEFLLFYNTILETWKEFKE